MGRPLLPWKNIRRKVFMAEPFVFTGKMYGMYEMNVFLEVCRSEAYLSYSSNP